MATTDNFSVCLMTSMDRLWFHQIILSQTDPSAATSLLVVPQTQEQQEENSSDSVITTTTTLQEEQNAERPTRLSPETMRITSYSSFPSTERRRRFRNLRYSCLTGAKLEKSMTWGELELEEVRGFMDLGFVFKKEKLSSRLMSIVPGLQRVGAQVRQDIDTEEADFDEDDDGNDVKMRPYLSEAWLIKKPDSPLLNLRVPRMSVSSDHAMKKHIRFWAKTVAIVLQQES